MGGAKRYPSSSACDDGYRFAPPILRILDHPHAGVMTIEYDAAFSRRMAPEVCSSLPAPGNPRAQGRPGARCTRGLVRDRVEKMLHTSIQVQRRTSGLPCAVALRLASCSPRRGPALLPPSPVRSLLRHGLDASMGGIRTTRLHRTRCVRSSAQRLASTASHRAFVTLADAPRNG